MQIRNYNITTEMISLLMETRLIQPTNGMDQWLADAIQDGVEGIGTGRPRLLGFSENILWYVISSYT